MTGVQVAQAMQCERAAFNQLYELYSYDFSEIVGLDVGEDGRYGVDDLAGCWSEPWRRPFLVRVDGKLAGFAIVDCRSRLTGDAETFDMAEFFIMRKYRRRGIGAYVAMHLFDRCPGRWEVRQSARNDQAQAFWRLVIGRYIGAGSVAEQYCDNATWRGPVQYLDSRAVVASRETASRRADTP